MVFYYIKNLYLKTLGNSQLYKQAKITNNGIAIKNDILKASINKYINAKTDVIFIMVNKLSLSTRLSGFLLGSIKCQIDKVNTSLNK